jgi:rhamnose transport system ATP-binding protein
MGVIDVVGDAPAGPIGATADAASRTPVMALADVSKQFGATRALQGAGIELFAGEVHALVGENGAGKSTLIKTMTGIHQPDGGEVRIDGDLVTLGSAAEAQRRGIVAIYQEPMIFPDLSVAENIFMGHRGRGRLARWRRMYDEAAAILGSLDIDIDPRAPANTLTVGAQQAVEIAKAISLDARVLIMDEPTASLSAHEAQRLFSQVDRLRARGVAVLFISHRLDEVFRIAERITVFRDGRRISTRPAGEMTEDLLVREMVGREVGDFFVRTRHEPGDVALRVSNLARAGTFEDVSFEVRAGEVVGLAGLVGAGRTDVGLALFGIAPADTGTIAVDGREVRINNPRDALASGIAYMTEDRRKVGLSLPQSVTANITLPRIAAFRGRFGLVDRDAERATAASFRDRLNIRTASLDTPVGNLSGGNQQKAMLAKWLNVAPRVLVLDEPTRGIDVGAKADVHRLIDDLAREGIAVVIISSDLPEVLAMSDRVIVMREGRVRGEFDHDDADPESVMTAMVRR